jgi:hypothetical protein
MVADLSAFLAQQADHIQGRRLRKSSTSGL